MRKIAFLLMLALISSFGCHNPSPTVNKKQDPHLSQIADTKDQNIKPSASVQNSKSLEVKGLNYSPLITSNKKITYRSIELTYVQDLIDSTGNSIAQLYVQIMNDSTFTKLFVLSNDSLRYYVGDGVLTNWIDSTPYNTRDFFGLEFIVRCNKYVTIEMVDTSGKGISDSWTIQYLDKKKKFDNPGRI
jgi:hypothetical protein